MDDPDCVGCCEATAEGDHVVQRRLRRQAVPYALFQIPSVYVLHRYMIQASVIDANVVDGHNMAMTHGGEHAAFIYTSRRNAARPMARSAGCMAR